MTANLMPKGLATGIGSFPHLTADISCQLIFKYFPHFPHWPQLPKRSFYEDMNVQFARGMPSLVMDNQRIYFNTADDESSLEDFYEKIIADDVDCFALGQQDSEGFFEFLRHLPFKTEGLKGQVTGPINFGLTVTDQNRKPILYDEVFADVIVKTLAMKARWQVRKLKEHSETVIIFVDEPYLTSIGSALISIKESDVIEKINEVIDAIHQEGASAGIHCCGNTDWGLVMATKTDIVSFDAYSYFTNFALYSRQIKDFTARNGILAWGITPTSEKVLTESVESLTDKLENAVDYLAEKGIEKKQLLNHSFVTPSCGVGTIPIQLAEEVIKKTDSVSQNFRRRNL